MLKAPNVKAFVCTLGVFFLLVILALLLSPIDQSVCGEYHQAAEENCPVHNIVIVGILWGARHFEAIGILISAIATAYIARYTHTLNRSTERLWETSERQLTATTAAYVYPVIVEGGLGIAKYVSDARVFWLDETKNDVPIEETIEMGFRIKNFGKTPAILETVYAGFGIWPVGAQIGMALAEAILGENETTSPLTAQIWRSITPREARKILTYEAHLCFSGTLTFVDIWGQRHVTEFRFFWEPESQRMLLNNIETKKANEENK